MEKSNIQLYLKLSNITKERWHWLVNQDNILRLYYKKLYYDC